MTVKDQIIIVGGYGHVGSTICRQLGALYPGKVYAAGRNFKRAEQLSTALNGQVKPMLLDISAPVDPLLLTRVKLVIMCLDQEDSSFVRACFQNGTHYIDVSASGSFLTEVEQMRGEAEEYGATAVLSVGLAPGLTNLLALQASKQLERTDSIDLTIMLGLGDRHGTAAIEWTVDQLSASFEVIENNRKVVVDSFTSGQIADFGHEQGRKRAYRFPFSDQQTLPHTLGVPSVATRLCFDSSVVTALVAGLRKSGLSRILRVPWVRNATVKCFNQFHFGEDRFAVTAKAKGRRAGIESTVECMLHGRNQSDMTARVAAYVAHAICKSSYPSGVFHIEQLFEIKEMKTWLQQNA
ncbi:saccharopine dehydrogenase NADP-binding domain-containing protein [Paenibacillus sp. UMB4589-SE434]|uniref:saccharopine dehydrogenase family protein n=1 Tax=Paenibacillus sp. UMB4589-SE434 TaxID=3046314 RepID=UPI002550098A|nr:saccharopine dehydrogenase NADP-binding domain-containing protein [Paenibacillus sp. UMB4589-SE434]MDK8181353.1 saccharopine dehydrogenase NADP-binding domain-containing protein [Paenibacillus sp. UMB4589-SE434]